MYVNYIGFSALSQRSRTARLYHKSTLQFRPLERFGCAVSPVIAFALSKAIFICHQQKYLQRNRGSYRVFSHHSGTAQLHKSESHQEHI